MCELVSIIVPVYNVQDYLRRCVISLINQTYKNIEIILVDDGSTDNSAEICDEMQRIDSRILVVHKVNGGLSDARNEGMRVASGCLYSFVDSDDYLAENTIEIMYNAMCDTNSDISICNMIQIFDTGETKEFYKPSNCIKIYEGNDRFETLKQPSVCNKLFRSEIFEKINFPKGKYYEDTYVYHELLYKAKKVVLTGHDGYWYFVRKGSILNREKYDYKYFDLIESVWFRAKFLTEKDVQPYGNEACLSLYIAISNMEKNMSLKKEYSLNISIAREKYKYAYNILMKKEANTNIKQKIRLVLLRYLPKLHSKIY